MGPFYVVKNLQLIGTLNTDLLLIYKIIEINLKVSLKIAADDSLILILFFRENKA